MRFTKWLAVVAAAAVVLAACAGGGGGKPSKLVIAAVQGDEDAGLKALAPDYEKETGIKLEIVELPYPQLYEKLVTTFKANDATYDLVMLDDPWMPKFGTDGSLQPLDKNYGFTRDSDIAGVIYDVGTWPPPRGPVPPSEKGKTQQLLGITIVGNVEMFMYRKDMSDAPKSYDDVLANAKKFNKPGFVGYAIRGKATNPVVADFLPILWSFGGDVFDKDWKVVIDSPASMKAVNFLVKDLKAVAEASPESMDAADRSRLMAIGQAYQSSVWPGEVAGIVNNATVSKVIGKVGYIPIPAGPSGKGVAMMGNWLLAIPKAAKNGQAAADFIKWMTKLATQQKYATVGGIPSRTSVLTDPSLADKNPYFKALADSLAAVPNWRPRTDQWNAVETVLGTNLNAALAGLATPEDAMKKAAGEITTLMKNAGY